VALALGLVAAGVGPSCPPSAPPYPAGDIRKSEQARFNVTTMQAEDEIAAIGAACPRTAGHRSDHHQQPRRRADETISRGRACCR
jgi:hypothetical protein